MVLAMEYPFVSTLPLPVPLCGGIGAYEKVAAATEALVHGQGEVLRGLVPALLVAVNTSG